MGFLRFQGTDRQEIQRPRWLGGINITANCRRLEAAMIGIHGRGSGAPVEIRKAISFDLPEEITASYLELHEQVHVEQNSPGSSRDSLFSLYLHVRRELACVEEEAIEELINESALSKNEVLVIGIHDAGIRRSTSVGLFYQSLCDAPFLADQTGLNIIDAFASQDVASQGNGGPVLTLPAWIFLKSDSQDRLLLDLGRTARTIFLPKAENSFSHQRIQYQDIVPCGSLLDTLTREVTQGKSSIDLGGRLTVQGCQVPELMTEFQRVAAPEFYWNSLGLSEKPFLNAVARLNGNGYSSQDVLCTASCFIAETIAEHVGRQVNELQDAEGREPDIFLTGSCRMHGMLMNLLSTQLRQRQMVPITQLGFPMETFDALCVALLSLMTIDHIPSNLPVLTGSESSKPLGHITPGNASNWHHLIQEMAQSRPAPQTLRNAV